MTAPFLAARALRGAATLGLAASSVALVASGYERSLRPCDAGVSQPESAFGEKGGL
jgi:hypothetical protein